MIELVENGNELKVYTPFSEGFNIKMRNLNGSFVGGAWVFANIQRIKEAVINNINEHFQIDYNAPKSNVEITALDDVYAHKEAVLLGGYELSIAKGKDKKYAPVKTGKKVILLSGEIDCGGSFKHWHSIVKKDAVFLIDNFPTLSFNPKYFEVKIIEEKPRDISNLLKSFTNEELKAELKRREIA